MWRKVYVILSNIIIKMVQRFGLFNVDSMQELIVYTFVFKLDGINDVTMDHRKYDRCNKNYSQIIQYALYLQNYNEAPEYTVIKKM